MYLLSNMTTSIAKEVYINMSSTYINNLEDKIEDKKNEYRRIILGLQTNDTFKNNDGWDEVAACNCHINDFYAALAGMALSP